MLSFRSAARASASADSPPDPLPGYTPPPPPVAPLPPPIPSQAETARPAAPATAVTVMKVRRSSFREVPLTAAAFEVPSPARCHRSLITCACFGIPVSDILVHVILQLRLFDSLPPLSSIRQLPVVKSSLSLLATRTSSPFSSWPVRIVTP